MSRDVIMGIDIAVGRLGIALADLATGKPISCLTYPIDRANLGPKHVQVRQVMATACAIEVARPVIVAVEDPSHAAKGKRQASTWGRIMGFVEAGVLDTWPDALHWTCTPNEWKKLVTGNGNANKGVYSRWARDEEEWPVPSSTDECGLDTDAAAAACIATWAFKVNIAAQY